MTTIGVRELSEDTARVLQKVRSNRLNTSSHNTASRLPGFCRCG